jgi:(p)ppGpp synthase/HD superfamily hydrolase
VSDDLTVRAEALARRLHAGQVDKQARDYAEHHLKPVAALLAPFGSEAVAAGWLHDAFEDTDVTEVDLRASDVPWFVIDTVYSVTRRDGESYDDLITRACCHPLGRVVKLMDNWVNLTGLDDLARTDQDTAARLRARYLKARARLLGSAIGSNA